MSAVKRARRALRRTLAVPLLMSTALMIVLGELLLRESGYLLLGAWTLTAVLAQTPVGERWTARLVFGARAPMTHQRYTLAPVADVLLGHGMTPARSELLVGRGRHPAVHGMGRGTLVVTRGFVEQVRCAQMSPRLAAAAIAHESAVVRAGLTRAEPALRVLLGPWRVWLTFMAFLWALAANFLPRRLMQLSLLISWGVGLWLGYSDHPVHYAGSAVLTVAFLTWWTMRSWERARQAVGDLGLLEVGLGTVYADFLEHHFTDDHTLDRAVALRHPAHADVRAAPARPSLASR